MLYAPKWEQQGREREREGEGEGERERERARECEGMSYLEWVTLRKESRVFNELSRVATVVPSGC
jgi:hypothetical protein